jgi:tubulin polyglutamylase TTLL6/13
MHLTNYAINKESESFIYNTDADQDHIGHKRSLTSVFGELEDRGVDID